MLFEICNTALLRSGFIFGLLPGWWLGTESNRVWSPLLSENDWDQVLKRTGFSGTEIILRDHLSDRLHLGSAIFTTVTSGKDNGHHQIPPSVEESAEIVILAEEGSTMQRAVADELIELLTSSRCKIVGLTEALHTNFDKKYCIFLPELERWLLSQMEQDQYTMIKRIITSSKGIAWVTKGGANPAGPDFDLVTGFARCIRAEYTNLNFITLALGPAQEPMQASEVAMDIAKVCKANLISQSCPVEQEFHQEHGLIHIKRIVECAPVNYHILSQTVSQTIEQENVSLEPLELIIESPGLLNTLRFVPDSQWCTDLDPEDVEIQVKATGLNFKDILVLLGQVASDHIGVECAGVISRLGKNAESQFRVGDRVLCVARGTYKTYARTKAALTTKIPDNLSFTSAASLPVAYGTTL